MCVNYNANFCLPIFITCSLFILIVGIAAQHSSQITVKVTMSHMYVAIIEVSGRKTTKRNAILFHCSPCLEVVCDDAVGEKLVLAK